MGWSLRTPQARADPFKVSAGRWQMAQLAAKAPHPLLVDRRPPSRSNNNTLYPLHAQLALCARVCMRASDTAKPYAARRRQSQSNHLWSRDKCSREEITAASERCVLAITAMKLFIADNGQRRVSRGIMRLLIVRHSMWPPPSQKSAKWQWVQNHIKL